MSFATGNLMLVILNLPLIGIWVSMLRIPYRALYPAVLIFVCLGVYTVNNNSFDIYMVAFFGIVGYLMIILDFNPAPLLLGFVMGPMMEKNLRRALLLSRGDLAVFMERPLSAAILSICAVMLAWSIWGAIKASAAERTKGTFFGKQQRRETKCSGLDLPDRNETVP